MVEVSEGRQQLRSWGVLIERDGKDYPSNAFAYMNLIEHWGSGIPRIIDKVKAIGLQESEFIGGEVDSTVDLNDLNNAIKVPDKTETVPDTMKKMPDSEQEQQIYKYVLEKGSITTANYLVYSSCVYNHIAAHARTDFIIYRNKKKIKFFKI